MLALLSIQEPAVVDDLNKGRFLGNVQGFVAMEGPRYLGFALYTAENGLTRVLDACAEEPPVVDALVRACVAAGERLGATLFTLNFTAEHLRAWQSAHGALCFPAAATALWQHCGG